MIIEKFDTQLAQIATLNWLPWVGENYEKDRILFIGDSYYDDGDDWLDDILANRNIITNILNSDNQYNFYSVIERTILNRDIKNEVEKKKFWTSVANINLVQRKMINRNERPSDNDFDTGWATILNVIETLKPKAIIKFGIDGVGRLGYLLNNKNEGWEYNSDEFYKT